MGGRANAEYYRRYRAEHPAYREREKQRLRQRRRRGKRNYVKEYQQRKRRRLQDDADGVLLESSLIRKAKQLALRVKRPDMRTHVYDDCYEELVCVCALALCEGTDPGAAMKQWMTERAKHARLWAPMWIR